MGADPIVYCLEQVTDYDQFERLCNDLMSAEGYENLEPLGGRGDKGRDAIRISRTNTDDITIFAYSVREDWQVKLKQDANRIKNIGHKCNNLVFCCTAHYNATERDDAVATILEEYGWRLELYGLERFRTLLSSKHERTLNKHPQIFTPPFFPRAGGQPLSYSLDLIIVDFSDEDEALATWLARKLKLHGYAVWCRSIDSFGGESINDTTEVLLEQRAALYLSLLSQPAIEDSDLSYRRAAAIRAGKKKGSAFLVPLISQPIYEESLDANTLALEKISFIDSWQTGLNGVIAILETANCPKTDGGEHFALNSFFPDNVVIDQEETIFSNIFKVLQIPGAIHRFESAHPILSSMMGDVASRWAFRKVDDTTFLSFYFPPDQDSDVFKLKKKGGGVWEYLDEIDGIYVGNLVPMLSKSRFLAGLQCPLRLWYQCYNRELAAPVSPIQQVLFNTGHKVGQMATRRYPGGILIEEDYMRHEAAIQTTIDVMEDYSVGAIFEAAYMEDGVRIRADILERLSARRWNLIEVKSSTKVKEEYLTDVAAQYHVLKMAGIDLERIYLMHIDREYILDGEELDLNHFLVLKDLTGDAIRLQDFVRDNLDRLKAILSTSDHPNVQPSRHCHQPHTCEFWDYCTRNAPDNWIFELSEIRQERLEDLVARGVEIINEIPDSFPLTAIQQRIRDCIIDSREYIAPDLHDALTDIKYPVHFLDFETIMPAIPRFVGARPYQTIPFQWSNHTLYPDGKIEHRDFLCDQNIDPRKDFTQSLLDVLGEEGTIFIYTTYEQRILRELEEQLPQYAGELNRIHSRFVDLCALIKNHYYDPAFHGSFSLKSVLPTLLPEMDYQNLAIQEGGMASLEYLPMIDPKTLAADKTEIRNNLLAYCGQDTLAMVKIREVLLGKTKGGSFLGSGPRQHTENEIF